MSTLIYTTMYLEFLEVFQCSLIFASLFGPRHTNMEFLIVKYENGTISLNIQETYLEEQFSTQWPEARQV